MNICVAINRCFVAGLRYGSHIFGTDDSLITEPMLLGVLNVMCGFVAVIETAWIIFYLFTTQLSYDYERLDSLPCFAIHVFLSIWLAYSVPYHYWKARSARPIPLPKEGDGPKCTPCGAPKPKLTSHCSTCRTCIYKMDHHCPWIGQCVGAHNQAHFFLFIFNVFLSTCLVLYVEYAFWVENWTVWTSTSEELAASGVKGHGRKAIFTFVIVVMLQIIMISFLCTYTFLVSGGLTYVMKLFNKQTDDSKQKMTLSIVRLRWRQYLAVRRHEWIVQALFIPSDRIVRDMNFFRSN